MRYISEYERHETKLRKIKNWLLFWLWNYLYRLTGFYPFADLETLFLLMTGNLCILWVSWVDDDRRLFILTVMMMIAQLSRVGLL